MEKIIKYILSIVLCFIVSFALGGCIDNQKSELVIHNSSNEEITEVTLDYTNSDDVDIGNIKSDEEFVHSINDDTDDSINIKFKDSFGNEHTGIAVGYITKNMGKTTIYIKKSDDKWSIEPEE